MFGKNNGKLLFDDQKPLVTFAMFQGAVTEIDDEGKIIGYSPRGEVVINVANIGAVYDHTIIIMGHKIRVMETIDEIKKRLRGVWSI